MPEDRLVLAVCLLSKQWSPSSSSDYAFDEFESKKNLKIAFSEFRRKKNIFSLLEKLKLNGRGKRCNFEFILFRYELTDGL